MNRNRDILKELQELGSPLAHMPWKVPYALPEGYWDRLAESLVRGVHMTQEADPELTKFPKALPFEVPEQYFSGLVERLKLASLEDNLPKSTATAPFAVPETYFQDLPQQLAAFAKESEQATEKKKAKLIALEPDRTRRIARIAAAAVLALGIGFGSYRYFRPAVPEQAIVTQLSGVEADAIESYVVQHVDDFESETIEAEAQNTEADLSAAMSTLDETEIEDYLLESGETSTDTQSKLL